MKVIKLLFFFSVLVFYKMSVIVQFITQLNTKMSQSQGIQNSSLKYILYWNEAYGNKGEEKVRNTFIFSKLFGRLWILLRYWTCQEIQMSGQWLSVYQQQVRLQEIKDNYINYMRERERHLDWTVLRSLLPNMTDWDAVWFASRSLPEHPSQGDMPGSRCVVESRILRTTI